MTIEEKELLFSDLCARLQYSVIVNASYKDGNGWKNEDRELLGIYKDEQVYLNGIYTTIENVKPYLRPMSSMTEEEKSVLLLCNTFLEPHSTEYKVNFYNQHHLDYRDLIEKGLAIEAPEGMYKIK